MKILKARPKLDLVFKKIFGDVANTDLLIDFLSAVLDIPINEIIKVEILDTEVIPEVQNKKFSRLDLLLHTSKGYINIEIQINNNGDFRERSIFYWAKVFVKQLDKGDEYSKLEPTISINIVDFNLFDGENPHSTFKLLETKRYTELSDKLRIDFLELPKAKKQTDNSKLQEWLNFLNVTTEEELGMLEQSTNNPKVIGKAIAVVRKMSADERTLYEIEKREETLRNERSALLFAEKRGKAEGKTEMIQAMYEDGDSIEKIAKISKFSIEEIKNILEIN